MAAQKLPAPRILDARDVEPVATAPADDETPRKGLYVATRRLVLELSPASGDTPARTLIVDAGEPFAASKAVLDGLAADAYREAK